MLSLVADRRRSRVRRRAPVFAAVLALLAGLLTLGFQQTATADTAADTDIAVGAAATASSAQGSDTPASAAVDGDATTRWSSAWSDPQWLQVDLGANASISGFSVQWEAAFATAYHIEVSADATAWTQVYATTAGAGGTESATVPAGTTGRYVRLTGTARTTIGGAQYGYSIFEFQVLGHFTQEGVSAGTDAVSLQQGTSVDLPVKLNAVSAAPVTVDYATSDGSAVAGTDYTAAAGTLTFAPGQTSQTIHITALPNPLNAPTKTFSVTLANASPAGTSVGPRATTTVSILNNNPLPTDGAVQTVDGFDGSVPISTGNPGLFPFGSDAASNPTLTQVAAPDVPGAAAGNQALQAVYKISGWGGFSRDLAAAQDWSAFDGFSFWVKGTGSGQKIEFEVKMGGADAEHAELWQSFFTDDVAGWKKVQVGFANLKKRSDYQPAGAPNNAQISLTSMWGYAVNLPGGSSNTLVFDDVQIYQSLQTLQDFEGANPITDTNGALANTGVFSWGGSSDSTPALSIAQLDRSGVTNNHALRATWVNDSSYGGISYDLATASAQDWSPYAGIQFWFYGHNPSNDAVPGSGAKYEFEVKMGGNDGEHSELWQVFFTDDWQGWHLIQVPFASLKRRTDFQPSGAPTNTTIDLTKMRGFALTEPSGTSNGEFDVDQFAVYGVNTGILGAHVGTTQPVYAVNPGGTATVGVTLTTDGGKALDHDVTVGYALGGGTAAAGTDYTDAGGTFTFAAGSASGSTQSFTVQTLPNTAASTARTIPVQLTPTGADVVADTRDVVINAHGLPYLDSSLPVATRVQDLLSRMSLDEKIGQMTQAERGDLTHQSDITTAALGSLLSGGGSTPTPNTAQGWADMIDAFQARAQATPLQIPLIYGEDSVHGDNNLVGATVFPQNIGMGATRDPALAEQEGQITATETRATGVTWAFAPCVCVARDPRWGRTYESFGEDPALVTQMETVIDGLQGDGALAKNTSVLATAKHYVGDGGTTYGTSTTGSYKIDQGVTKVTQPQLQALYLAPFQAAVQQHGIGSVMPSYSSLQIVGQDTAPIKMHARADMITGVLKQQYGFSGFVISDWNAIDQIGPDYEADVQASINAGLDMIMVPANYATFIGDLKDLVAKGLVAPSRIDDAVGRILTQKFKLGLFEQPYADRSNASTIGGAAHRAVARKAAAESQVLLKNAVSAATKVAALPLSPTANVYVAGSNADNLGNQAGGWTVTWQGGSGDTDVGTTILQGMRADAPNAHITYSADASAPMTGSTVGVVVVGETPYAEGVGDVGNGKTLDLSAADKAAVDKVCAAMQCVVLIVSGRPMDIASIQAEANSIVASWLPGTEGEGVADTLFGASPFTGRLPDTWAKQVDTTTTPVDVGIPATTAAYDPLYPYGWGLRTDSQRARVTAVRDSLAKQAGIVPAVGATILTALLNGKGNWNADGSLAHPGAALALIAAASPAVQGTSPTAEANANLLVSVVRDIAEKPIVAGGAAAMTRTAVLTADGEHALMSGDAATAIAKLTTAYLLAAAAGH